jgi:hypothetical protein
MRRIPSLCLLAAISAGLVLATGPLAGAASHPSTHTPPITSLSATKILAAAEHAEATVGSVHVIGEITEAGHLVTFNLLAVGSDNGVGNFTQAGDTVQIAKIGQNLYFNAPRSFWLKNSSATAANSYGGKWILTSASSPDFSVISQFMDPNTLVPQLFASVTSPIKKGKVTKILGVKVIPITGSFGTGANKTTSALYVATSGTPYVIALTSRSGTNQTGAVNFSHYGAPGNITPPPHPIVLSPPTTTTVR